MRNNTLYLLLACVFGLLFAACIGLVVMVVVEQKAVVEYRQHNRN